MPKKFPPLTPDEVIEILKTKGFTLNNTVGSHAQYVGIVKGEKRRVTVDLGEKDFGDTLMKSMVRHSGLTREEFYCSSKSAAKKIGKRKGNP